MTQKPKGSDRTSGARTINEKINKIYASGDESAIHELTKLLIASLRDGDRCSRSALGEFFGVSVSQTAPDPAGLDYDLIRNAVLFINGENVRRVQNWISSYKASAPHSWRRSWYEDILHIFVSSRTTWKSIQLNLKRTSGLATDARSKCNALQRIVKSIPNSMARLS